MNGRKSYIIAVAIGLYAIGGLVSGNIEAPHAWELMLEALALAGIRHAVTKAGN
jgi:hypothetical protein